MALRIGSNISALGAQRCLAEAASRLNKTYERLSSGQRINRASDDAAGLAIADTLKADTRVYSQGIRNLNDGLSLLNVADQAAGHLTDITTRITELAAQAATGSYNSRQREALDAEAQALSQEFSRIIQSTKFNGRQLLDGSLGELRLQAGYGADGGVTSGLGGAYWNGVTAVSSTDTYVEFGSGSGEIETADVNGDGILDAIGVGWTGLSVSMGRGDGSFGAAATNALGAGGAMALGDINNDGTMDIVTSWGSGVAANILIGRNDGTFSRTGTYTMPLAIQDVQLGDLNGDGLTDLITSGSHAVLGKGVSLRFGEANGRFGSATFYSMSAAGESLTVDDVNADGALDLISAGGGVNSVRLGAGDGSFGTASDYTTTLQTGVEVKLGDVNGDGFEDMITTGMAEGVGTVSVRLGSSSGVFGSEQTLTTGESQMGAYGIGLAVADIDGSGTADIITGCGADLAIVFGSSDGILQSPVRHTAASNFGASTVAGIALGDLNGDGVLDFITLDNYDPDLGFSSFLSTTKSGIQPLLPFSLRTAADARQTLPILERKREQLALQRGVIGAFQARLSTAANTLSAANENSLNAASRIRDADVAEEAAGSMRLNILRDAAASVLAQASQQPSLALQLLP